MTGQAIHHPATLARGQLEKIAAEEARAAEKQAKEAATADASAIRAQATAEARAILQRAETGARAAEEARKAAEEETERLRKLIAKMETGGVAGRPEPVSRVKPAVDQVVCDFRGCRPVRPGCKIANAVSEGTVNGWAREVCN